MLNIHNACKFFGRTVILDHINLSVQPACILGLAGPSGGGKSTLLRCIQQLETLDSGRIECQGRTGFMFQDFQLFPHMTVLKNVLYAKTLQDKSTNYVPQAEAMLQNLGLLDKAQHYPHQLSGGQKQRVALARSLMMHPEILLCDEPTSGLDIATTQDVVALLNTVRDLGVTMILASHDLDFLTKISDRIVLLKAGHMVVDIEPKQISDPIQYLKDFY
jgi:polar amino acid transport system ATP-binding protein